MLATPPPSPPAVAACLRRLPSPPAGLHRAVALDAGCALVVLGPGRRVTLRSRPHPQVPPGAQVAADAGVVFRGRHVTLVRAGRVAWRSRRTFAAGRSAGVFTNVSSAAAGREGLAYVVSRWSGHPRREHRLLFVAPPDGPERLVSTTAWPLGWTPSGLLATEVAARRLVVRVYGSDGRVRVAPRVVRVTSWSWDWASSRLVLLAGDRVLRSDGRHTTVIGHLGALGLSGHGALQVAAIGSGLVAVSTASRAAVLAAGGGVRARVSLPAGWRIGTIAAAAGGGAALEATRSAEPGARRFRLYGAAAGGRARLLGAYDVPASCAGHGLSVRGGDVLVSAPGLARAYRVSSPGRFVDLQPAVRFVRARGRAGTVGWYPWR